MCTAAGMSGGAQALLGKTVGGKLLGLSSDKKRSAPAPEYGAPIAPTKQVKKPTMQDQPTLLVGSPQVNQRTMLT